MSSLEDRRRGPRRRASSPENFGAMLALGLAGLFLGAALSYWLESTQLLRDWANPI
jgi:hypothetical protein